MIVEAKKVQRKLDETDLANAISKAAIKPRDTARIFSSQGKVDFSLIYASEVFEPEFETNDECIKTMWDALLGKWRTTETNQPII